MYLERMGLLASVHGKYVQHFAPWKRLGKRITAAATVRYVPRDLYPSTPDVQRADMLNMPFEDRTYDLVIANQMLEYVDDDVKALAESTAC